VILKSSPVGAATRLHMGAAGSSYSSQETCPNRQIRPSWRAHPGGHGGICRLRHSARFAEMRQNGITIAVTF
jgi:hypothetical protein